MAWKSIREVGEEVKKYVEDRRTGKIQSCRTGYPKLDRSSLNGFEWGTTITIGARPSGGKTIYSSCLMRGMLKHNDIEEMAVLDFNWEMSSKALLIRDLSADMSMSYQDILSAEKPISDQQSKTINSYVQAYQDLPIYFEEEPKTAKEFADAIRRKRDELSKIGKKKLIVRIDHTILAKRSASEANQVEMLHNLLFEANIIKKESDVIFIFLTQALRALEERQEDGTDRAFPKQFDIYGGDATSMFSETMLLLNRPSRYGITYYGKRPNGVIPNPDQIFIHCVKNRNAPPDLIITYKSQFETMQMFEE